MAFMVPSAQYLSETEAREYLEDPEAEAGWYGRLSAPGYLDCTDWMGPFETAEDALEEVMEFWEVDENGESTDIM